MSLVGIFELQNNPDVYVWADCFDKYELKTAKYLVDDSEAKQHHRCIKSALYHDMTGYVDEVQNENLLPDDELYVVTYYEFDAGSFSLLCQIDFGITKQEILENVEEQKYVEGASYYTMGQMFYTTRTMMEKWHIMGKVVII